MDADTKRIAKQRIKTLFSLAKETMHEDSALAQRYIDIAKKIAMSAKTTLPTEYRRQICRHCKSFIYPGVNCRVRVQRAREPHVAITCLACGETTRILLRSRGKR